MMGSWACDAALLAPLTGALPLVSLMVAAGAWLLRRRGFVEAMDSEMVAESWIEDILASDQDTVGLYAPGDCIHAFERGS